MLHDNPTLNEAQENPMQNLNHENVALMRSDADGIDAQSPEEIANKAAMIKHLDDMRDLLDKYDSAAE